MVHIKKILIKGTKSGGVCFIFQMIMLDTVCHTFCHSQIKLDAINIFIMLFSHQVLSNSVTQWTVA